MEQVVTECEAAVIFRHRLKLKLIFYLSPKTSTLLQTRLGSKGTLALNTGDVSALHSSATSPLETRLLAGEIKYGFLI